MDLLADFSTADNDLIEKPLPPVPRKPIQRRVFHVSGCQGGLQFCAGLTAVVLLVNVVWTICVAAIHGIHGGLGTIQHGRCTDTKNLSLWLHLLINALSTSLLSASNYTMQCLASPTRREVDKAHSVGKSLEVGITNVGNLIFISWNRSLLFVLLAISGIPLHLMYNTAVFSELATVSYTVTAASPALASHEDGVFNSTIAFQNQTLLEEIGPASSWQNFRSWQKLDRLQCLEAYGQSLVAGHGNLVVVTDAANSSTEFENVGIGGTLRSDQPSYMWICYAHPELQGRSGSSCDIDKLKAKPARWQVQMASDATDSSREGTVEYCLSQPQEERCSLQFSMMIMWIVIVMNAVKVTCMVLALRSLEEIPLVTLGDAMQSFLHSNDPTTAYRCIASHLELSSEEGVRAPLIWHNTRPRWFRGASTARWASCMVCSFAVLLVTSILLIQGLQNPALLTPSLSHLWSLGFGAVTSESISSAFDSRVKPTTKDLLRNILIANSPQLVLSFLYLFYNSLYTSMLMTEEWFGYAKARKYLRVSNPAGGQRSTYRLQLPYKYGIPLLILSGILHWLVSQSLFLVEVQGYDVDGQIDISGRLSTLGYSCIAIIFVIILGVLTLLVGLGMGCRRYAGGMPLARSCSAAISAACHQPAGDLHTEHRPLMWGVAESEDVGDEGVGHCSFTSLPVVAPREGMRYAGGTGTSPGILE